MRIRAFASLIVVVAAGILAGCDQPPATHRYAVVFAGRTDAGRPLPGVQIAANGKPLGETGPEGGLAVGLRAVEGKRLQIATTCPEGYRAANHETEVRLRRVAGAGSRNQVTVAAECWPSLRRAVVLVRTPHLAGVPVLFRDREIARTDADGIAHVLLTMAPETRFQLALDTSDHPRLRPRDPTSSFVLGDRDQIFVFDYQPVANPLPKKKPRIRRAPPPPPGPVKIESLQRRRGRR